MKVGGGAGEAMHFLISTFGSAGEVFPVVGLALALQQRGHEATIATNPHVERQVRRHGIGFESMRTEEDFFACIEHPDLWDKTKAFGHIEHAMKPVLRRQYERFEAYAARDAVGLVNELASAS